MSIYLNRDNLFIVQLKRVENLRQLYESRLIFYLEEQLPGAAIILFGSYARGEDLSTSDIDLAVIGRKEKSLNLKVYEQKLLRPININYYPHIKKIHKNLRENIYNGIVLLGRIEL